MSSLSLQAGQIRAALIAAGLPAAAAADIAGILGNSAQQLRHAGPVIHDRTPPGLRFVDPDTRKHSLTNADFRQADPDYRATRSTPSENVARPTQESSVREDRPPQQTAATHGVAAGPFVKVESVGAAARVGVNLAGDGDLLFADPRSNTFVAKRLLTEASGLGGTVRFSYEPRGNEVALKLLIDADNSLGGFERNVPVVTDIRLGDGGLEIVKRSVSGWFGEQSISIIPTSGCE